MFDPYQLEKMVFFDIETAGSKSDLSQLSSKMQDLWENRAELLRNQLALKYPDNIGKSSSDLFKDKAALHAEFGRIVCISFGKIKFNETGEPVAQILSYTDDSESLVLENAFKVVAGFTKKGCKLTGHNIKRFDIPFLCKRAFINHIEVPQALQVWDKKPWEIPVIDTSELWSFGAWQEGFTSLDLLSTVLGLPSPKDEMHGDQVHGEYYAGNIKEIQKYCEKDVVALIKIAISLSNLNQIEESNIIYKVK